MADLATSMSRTFTEAGVKVGDQTFRAWPCPEANRLLSLFAFAWNIQPALSGGICIQWHWKRRDQPIVFQFPKKEQPKYTVHNLVVSDQFMQKVIGELDPNGSGDPWRVCQD